MRYFPAINIVDPRDGFGNVRRELNSGPFFLSSHSDYWEGAHVCTRSLFLLPSILRGSVSFFPPLLREWTHRGPDFLLVLPDSRLITVGHETSPPFAGDIKEKGAKDSRLRWRDQMVQATTLRSPFPRMEAQSRCTSRNAGNLLFTAELRRRGCDPPFLPLFLPTWSRANPSSSRNRDFTEEFSEVIGVLGLFPPFSGLESHSPFPDSTKADDQFHAPPPSLFWGFCLREISLFLFPLSPGDFEFQRDMSIAFPVCILISSPSGGMLQAFPLLLSPENKIEAATIGHATPPSSFVRKRERGRFFPHSQDSLFFFSPPLFSSYLKSGQ